ncbi:MAG TPA: hypothetical protein VHV55_14450 [Pirellulales bacterium]|jgi:hypothetical protein|nr:hypothetical protein [Pirellulales bacterium]
MAVALVAPLIRVGETLLSAPSILTVSGILAAQKKFRQFCDKSLDFY